MSMTNLKKNSIYGNLKSIFNSRHNEDGSYTYGYEAADGSFKLETRHPDGRVEGKYGYLDIHTGELKATISRFFFFSPQ